MKVCNPMTISISARERDAIRAGLRAAAAAMDRARSFAFLELFVGPWRSHRSEPKLDALRAYAELRHVLTAQGRTVTGSSLLTAGYTVEHIARFDALIAT